MSSKVKKPCAACGRGFTKECTKGGKCDVEGYVMYIRSGGALLPPETSSEPSANKSKGNTAKDLKDAHSTGRKRAAQLYPLDRESACEWQGKKNCGGGRVPIVGCTHGLQVARHHGPVKDTTRNQLGNVHRICTRCHNHWHELNDLVYVERDYGMLPHDPVDATPDELIADEMKWVTGAMGKEFELASSRNKNVKFEE